LADLWVEETLRELLGRLLQAQRESFRRIETLSSKRASTRQELWRRLNRARDFIRAQFHRSLTLSEIASVACLSPFHFLRGFRKPFT
jgi:AraC-like DNA-binding protein